MKKHILYLNYILYIYRSDKFIWRKLRASLLATVFFYDFETQQCERVDGDDKIRIHVPNLCVVQQVCNFCDKNTDISAMCTYCGVREYVFDRDPVQQFVNLVFAKRKTFKHIICIAHNAQGFDSQFILKYIMERGDTRVKSSVILNGTKIILMKMKNVKFLDSLNYLHMPLSALPKAYGLTQIEKGTFPYLFNTSENQNHIGELPPLTSHSPDTMAVIERENFLEWYNDQKKHGYIFEFQKEILKYCKQDVNILRLACLAFRETFLICSKVDPFTEAATIASYCLRVYRKNFQNKILLVLYLKEGTDGRIINHLSIVMVKMDGKGYEL